MEAARDLISEVVEEETSLDFDEDQKSSLGHGSFSAASSPASTSSSKYL